MYVCVSVCVCVFVCVFVCVSVCMCVCVCACVSKLCAFRFWYIQVGHELRGRRGQAFHYIRWQRSEGLLHQVTNALLKKMKKELYCSESQNYTAFFKPNFQVFVLQKSLRTTELFLPIELYCSETLLQTKPWEIRLFLIGGLAF